jgi:hypothetical protein
MPNKPLTPRRRQSGISFSNKVSRGRHKHASSMPRYVMVPQKIHCVRRTSRNRSEPQQDPNPHFSTTSESPLTNSNISEQDKQFPLAGLTSLGPKSEMSTSSKRAATVQPLCSTPLGRALSAETGQDTALAPLSAETGAPCLSSKTGPTSYKNQHHRPHSLHHSLIRQLPPSWPPTTLCCLASLPCSKARARPGQARPHTTTTPRPQKSRPENSRLAKPPPSRAGQACRPPPLQEAPTPVRRDHRSLLE